MSDKTTPPNPENWKEISVEDLKRIMAESKDDKDFRKRIKEFQK